jgi:geranylgeranyl diphosphate synthase, type II
MESIQSFQAYIESETAHYSFPKGPANLYDPLRYFMTLGGKRMRPVLTLMAGDCFGVPKNELLAPALAIEFFHNFSLIHDDIMDVAPTRRGQSTVHEKWNTNIAILSGDVLLVEAYKQLVKVQDHRLNDLMKCFNKTAVEVCEGQQMDMDFESRNDVHESEYIEMIRLKTSVLLGCALEFGAIMANSCADERIALYNFGVNLGIAFQIQDDILDLFADSDTFGKQVGGDVLSSKKTLLMILAKKANPEAVRTLLAMENDEHKVKHAQELFDKIGAKKQTQEQMEMYHDRAILALKGMPIPQEKLSSLYEMADFLFARTV